MSENQMEYTLRVTKRARYMRLAVYPGGRCVVTVPFRMNPTTAQKFIAQKSEWILDKLAYFRKFPANTVRRNTKKEFRQYKEKALTLVKERIEYFNAFYNFSFNRISIKNQKTRWGSCSKKGNLNFNYRIALLPVHLAEYIVVHELCHLVEFNHSPRFWDLVGKTIPNHAQLRRNLKQQRIF